MNVWAWLSRRICPSCRHPEPVDRHPAIQSLEQANDALDQISGEIRRIREQMRTGPNPLLGDPPHRREGGR